MAGFHLVSLKADVTQKSASLNALYNTAQRGVFQYQSVPFNTILTVFLVSRHHGNTTGWEQNKIHVFFSLSMFLVLQPQTGIT